MSPEIKFGLAFLATLLALLGVLFTGLRWRTQRRRGLHIGLVGLTLALLGWTIYEAYALGDHFDLESAGRVFHVHMFLARAATVALLIPATSGLVVLKTGRYHSAHRIGAFVAVALVTLAAITGVWMLSAATPLPG